MSQETRVSTLYINELTKEQYDSVIPSDNELYFITDTLDCKYDTLPNPEAKYEDQITQYTGPSGGAESSATVSSDRTDWYKSLTIDKTTFENAYHPTGNVVVEFVSHNDEGVVTWTLNNVEVNLADYGISYDDGSAPESGIKIIVEYVAGRGNYENGYFYKCTAQGTDPETYAWVQVNVQDDVEVVDSVETTYTERALSANMGKELQDQITNLKNIGRFLSVWNCVTGLPTTDPVTTGTYSYKTGDYYRIGIIAEEGGTNYKPYGTVYVPRTPSTEVETEEIAIGDIYMFDGNAWFIQKQGSGGKVQDVQINGTSILNLDSGVANIPVASSSVLGVAKVMPDYGINMGGSGQLVINRAVDSEVVAKTNTYKPIVPSNLDKAIMEGLGNNSLTWSALYKSSACSTIGAQQEINLHIDSTL